jgi:hypothetical protein
MALVNKLIHQALERDSKHTEVECTYSIVADNHGPKQLQIDTYGSSDRKIPGKKSQSIRLSPQAIKQLKQILQDL